MRKLIFICMLMATLSAFGKGEFKIVSEVSPEAAHFIAASIEMFYKDNPEETTKHREFLQDETAKCFLEVLSINSKLEGEEKEEMTTLILKYTRSDNAMDVAWYNVMKAWKARKQPKEN